MRVDVMLCDFAQVHQGKLFVSGAGISLLGTPTIEPPHPISAFIAGIVTVPWNATNQAHHLVAAVDTADGKRVALTQPLPGVAAREGEEGAFAIDFNVGRAPIMTPGEDALVPFVFPLQNQYPEIGGYCVTVSVAGTELARASFRIMAPQPATGPQF